MIRFGRIFDLATEVERRKLGEVEEIFRACFAGVPELALRIGVQLKSRSTLGFEPVLLTAEGARDEVLGFASVQYYPELRHAYLDFIASHPGRRARGIGEALYEALREHLSRKGAQGLLMDVPPDDPAVVADRARLQENQRRLAFYERLGARPIVGTAYQEPLPHDPEMPYLVYDPLGADRPLGRAVARRVVGAILLHRYDWKPEEPRTRKIVQSFQDDPVRLREPRYAAAAAPQPVSRERLRPVKLVMTPRHDVHHVRERGYVERPARIDTIRAALRSLPFEERPLRSHGERDIRAVHDADFVNYIHAACAKLGPQQTLYPYVFPIRRPERKPKDRAVRAGYYCIDTFTPLSREALRAARDSVDCALTGADLLERGERLVYALCRPPGHHAERRVFGGFCYFNNAAIAAHRLSRLGRVAMLDIDFHHGNGAQDIFYQRDDILTISIHGHPNHAYPYFSGFADERGEDKGKGFNRNYPLPEGVDDDAYLKVLNEAVERVRAFCPAWLVVPLGFDIMRGDPTGSFLLTSRGMARIGTVLGRLGLPTLVVQEGGYMLRNLRRGAQAFFTALAQSWF